MPLAVRSLLIAVAFSLFGCNIADEGGGIEVECLEDSECPNGRCSNGICIDLGSNNDAGNNVTTTDMGTPEDMSVDMNTEDMGMPDMDVPFECPDGFINFNGDEEDGCETIEFPGWQLDTCQACAGAPNAVTGCGGGSECAIAACADGFYDRDGRIDNGCEATCAPGECWNIVTAEHAELVYVEAPDLWVAITPTGLVGRSFGGDDFVYHSLDGPRDFNAVPVRDLHVLGETIYGVRDGQLVRSVDHARTFGPVPGTPNGSVIDLNLGADDRYYLLVEGNVCEPAPCTDDTECAANPVATLCSTAEGACGSSKCARPQDCGAGQHCSTDGICVDDPSSCAACANAASCGAGRSVVVSNDLRTFMPIGSEIPGAQARAVFGSIDSYPIVALENPNADGFLFDPTANDWVPVDTRSCRFTHMLFFASGDGVGIGENCSFEFDAQKQEFNNRENIDGLPNDVLLHQDVIYVVGDGFVSVSTSFGSNYNDRPLNGNAIYVFADGTNGVVAVGSRGERWRSVDRGQSWVEEVEAFLPFPREVEAGSPLSIVGLSTTNEVITPTADPTARWLTIAPQTLASIKQDNGAAFGFVNNSVRLYSGTDWQSLNPMSISNQIVDATRWPACSGAACRIATVASISDAAYDGTVMAVVARVNLQARFSAINGFVNVGQVDAILTSPNGVSWTGVQYFGAVPPTYLGASDFGFVTDRGYSSDGVSWFTNGTPNCGQGPFFRGPNGEIFGFGNNSFCSTDAGDSWTELSTSFWLDEAAQADSFYIVNGAFLAPTSIPGATVINSSADGGSWTPVGPSWPSGTDIAFGSNNAAVAHPHLYAVAR